MSHSLGLLAADMDLSSFSLEELYMQYDLAKQRLFDIRAGDTPHTKKFHLIKTNSGAAHIGLMLGPSWALGISKLQASADSVTWWQKPFFLEFSVEGFISCLTYSLYLPVGIIDTYQRIHRRKLVKNLSALQRQVANILLEINSRAGALQNYQNIAAFERLFHKRLQFDVNRHSAQLFLNGCKLVTACAALTTQALKFMTVIPSVHFFSVLSSSVGFPFIFAGLTLITTSVDLYYAARKLYVAKKELQQARAAYEGMNILEDEQECPWGEQLLLKSRMIQRVGAFKKAKEREHKRVIKVAYRIGLTLVALCVCLPVFSFPPLVAAIAGTVSLVAMMTYSWYQRGEHKNKVRKSALVETQVSSGYSCSLSQYRSLRTRSQENVPRDESFNFGPEAGSSMYRAAFG